MDGDGTSPTDGQGSRYYWDFLIKYETNERDKLERMDGLINSNLVKPTKMDIFLSKIGDKFVSPLFKIKGLSESSSPYPLILLSIILLSISLSSYLLLFGN